ncbi:MAG: type II secretion system ATPase GspE [Endozoicomonadaceae bacterium]|nr:type II secretion system ATPase GspE [Endozoicomonadaceae bacterium]
MTIQTEMVSATPQEEADKKILPFSFARRYRVVLTLECEPTLWYMLPITPEVLSEVRRFFEKPLRYQRVEENELSDKMTETYHQNTADSLQEAVGLGDDIDFTSLADAVPAVEDLMEQADDAPVIKLINALLTESIKEEASDIHLETFDSRVVARYRVDGVLREVLSLQPHLAALLVSRIKVMAKLDIAEKRIPQDGRISLKVAGREVDVRVSTLPSRNGERVVLRLLDKAAGRLTLKSLGLSAFHLSQLTKMLMQPHGIILVTGPTGSGKTTTLYGGLATLNDPCRNILTIEDPIEYNLEGIGQTQVNVKVGMTFAAGLRAILRQDPDVVMVGEIRDKETAEIAVQASLTGHLVLSTLHTNTAIGAIARLKDMAVEPFLLASSLGGIVAQRLVRVLCEHCKESYSPTESECKVLRVDIDSAPTLFKPKGCEECRSSGYRGRTGIYETLLMDKEVRRMIHSEDSEQNITEYIRKTMPSIHENGAEKILEGLTTIEEVLRVTHQD